MARAFVTFNEGQEHRISNVKIDHNCIVAIDRDNNNECHEMAFNLFGNRYKMVYYKSNLGDDLKFIKFANCFEVTYEGKFIRTNMSELMRDD